MTGISITSRGTQGFRVAMAAVLLAGAVVLGAGIGRVATSLTGSHQPDAGATSLSGDAGYLAYRADERHQAVPLSGSAGYQGQRAGERAPDLGLVLSQDAGWQAQRAGERGATP